MKWISAVLPFVFVFALGGLTEKLISSGDKSDAYMLGKVRGMCLTTNSFIGEPSQAKSILYMDSVLIINDFNIAREIGRDSLLTDVTLRMIESISEPPSEWRMGGI